MRFNSKQEFYIDIDKSSGDWTYSLRLRDVDYPNQIITGFQVAIFNSHTCIQNSDLMDFIIDSLNKNVKSYES